MSAVAGKDRDNTVAFYLPKENTETFLKKYYHKKTVEILLTDDTNQQQQGGDDEIVTVNIPKDLTDDPTELSTVLENYTSKKEIWLSVAVSYGLQNKFVQAEEIIKTALGSSQFNQGSLDEYPFRLFNAALNIRRARICDNFNQRDDCLNKAKNELDIALSLNSVDAGSDILRAELFNLTNPGNLDNSLSLYEVILKQHPDNVFGLFGKAKILLKKRNYSLALKIFQQILILNPLLKPDSRIGIGLCFWYLGDLYSAMNSWERSFELFPNDFASGLLLSIVKFNKIFNESLTDKEFIKEYSEVINLIADYYNGNNLPGYENEENEDDDEGEAKKSNTIELIYKKNPYLISILSSYLFSKEKFGLLIQLIEDFINHDVNNLNNYNPLTISDFYFWISRTYFTIAVNYENIHEYKDLSKDLLNMSKEKLLNRSQQLIAKSLSFDKNNIFTRFLNGQIFYYKENIDEAILVFETLIKNFELSSNLNLKNSQKESKNKLIEIHYMLGLLYHEKVFGEFVELNSIDENGNLQKKKNLINDENTKNIKKSTDYLTNYFKLCLQTKESIILNAHLTLAKNYEYLNEFDKVLNNLEKAVELYKLQNVKIDETTGAININEKQIPTEILNNIGVFQFLKNNLNVSKSFFKLAKDSNEILEDEFSNNRKITIDYNLIRVQESELLVNSENDESMLTGSHKIETLYKELLVKSPNYIYAKLRIYYTLANDPFYNNSEQNIDYLDGKIQKLLSHNEDNLEIRSFYGWFLKKFNKKISSVKQSKENLEDKLYKDTLNKFDSHDTYSLISLGNIYLSLARDGKSLTKQNNYFIRATQLYQKVLSIDPNNLYAAQGIAIIFAELKKSYFALEIFRKIRDSLNDVSVFVNLGHVFIDVGEYGKAIECYEIAINRFDNDKIKESAYLNNEEINEDINVFDEEIVKKYSTNEKYLNSDNTMFTLLGRAWYCRGIGEKSLESLMNSLKYTKKAYLMAIINPKKIYQIPSLKFNIAFIYFQIAEFVRKSPKSKRSSEEITKTINNLEVAITLLEELAKDDHPPYPAEDLSQRASMGTNTIKNGLLKELEIQKAYEQKFADKIEEGKKIREIEKRRMKEEQEKLKLKEELEQKKLREEREKLQKDALEWANDLAERNRLAEEEEAQKKKKIIDDDGWQSGENSDEESKEVKKKKKKESKKRSTEPKEKPAKKAKKLTKKYKSADTINDSDEEAEY